MKVRIDYESWNEDQLPYRVTAIYPAGGHTQEQWLCSFQTEEKARSYAEAYLQGPKFIAELEK